VECSDHEGMRPIHLVDHSDVLRLLLNAKVSVHTRTSTGLGPLHLASITTGGESLVTMLIEAHAGINAVDDKGNSALHMASRHSQLECMRVLLRANANLEAKNKLGQTPLLCVLTKSEMKPNVVEFLINAKANIEARGIYGGCKNGTALHFGIHV